MGSRGSVIPHFMELAISGELPITDMRMTRFMMTLEEAVTFVWRSLGEMVGGEIFVKKSPSMRISDIAKAVSENAKLKVVGFRPGEKLHEQMIGVEDAPHTFDYGGYFKILPSIHNWSSELERIGNGTPVGADFRYDSEKNNDWMSIDSLKRWIIANRERLVKL
jgi:FlaA1/EpsC-like NDP-sugar epimerase